MAASSTESFGAAGYGGLLKPSTWASEVMATASTEAFWEDDPEELVKKKILELKTNFHMGRQLQIKHLPRDVTEEEIRELLSDFPVLAVQLQCGTGTGAGVARASLEDPEMLEEWDRDRVFMLRGQRVPVAPTPTDMLLCVARLPLHYTDNQFSGLVRSYGEVRRCFLMISEKSGESKGYGFVEYSSKETAMHAKNMLDRKPVEDQMLCCDWLDSSHVTFESLHSKCLFVDHLPKDFRDMGQFRKVFSAVVSPPYCQIALKNGCPQDWGLVEYSSSEDAEAAQTTVNGFTLGGHRIRVSYYMPGVRAINLYLKLLNESNNKKSCGLLPDPTAPAVFQQLQTLAKQNPVFAQNLQNIIMTQIQSLQSEGKQRPPSPAGTPPVNKPKSVPTPPNGLLDNAQMQQLKNQLTSSHPMLMANPQMLASLQNLLKQQQQQQQQPDQGGEGGVVNGQGKCGDNFNKHNHAKNGFLKPAQPQQKVPLLPNPGHGLNSPPPLSSPGQGAGGGVQLSPTQSEVSPWGHSGMMRLPRHHTASPTSAPSPAAAAAAAAAASAAGGMPLLMPGLDGSGGMAFPGGDPLQMSGDLQSTINSILNNQQNLRQLMATLSNAIQSNGAPPPPPAPPVPPPPGAPCFSFRPPPGAPPPPLVGPDGWANPSSRSLMSSPIQMQPKPMGFLDIKTANPAPMFNQWPGNGFMPSPVGPMFSPYSMAGLWSPSPPPTLLPSPQNGLMTPVGHKRKYNHILPSPEPSPEGNYIGQHSQGLGGHYADSYFKRKKKN